MVDPLDGTTNFAAGIPCWAISIARFVDGRPSEVFLDVPALNQRFVALRGRGVSRNASRSPGNPFDSDQWLRVVVQPFHSCLATQT